MRSPCHSKNDRHDRVADLFEAAYERPDWKHRFDMFVDNFLVRYPPEKDNVPLKRFLALHEKELHEKRHIIFRFFCYMLLNLKRQLDNPASQKLLIDLAGQPWLLTPVAFARAFLYAASDTDRANFIKYGYKEAIQIGLKEKYPEGSRKLWKMMVRMYPNQFSGKYPSTEARTIALKDFRPTRQDRGEEWAKKNARNLRMKLEMLVPDLLPTALLGIVSEYAVTWIAFSWSPPQNQLRPQIGEQVTEKFEALMSEKRYVEIVELGNSMENDVLANYLYPLMATTEHCMYLNGYLNGRGMLPSFLILGGIEIVRKAILEFDDMDSDYYIFDEHIWDAITLSIKEHRDDRAISLLQIERERHATADEQRKLAGKTPRFEVLLRDFSKRLIEKRDTAPLKRFLTINKEELDEGWLNIFEIICQGMVSRLSPILWDPDSQKLLTDFVGQPSLITTTAFANGFLEYDDHDSASNFISYGWRDALEEGLKEKHQGGGRYLWDVMVSEYSDQFSGEYPSTDEERIAAVRSFKTKQDREEEWAKENAPIFLPKLVAKLQEPDILILLPSNRWSIVVKYAATDATWVDV